MPSHRAPANVQLRRAQLTFMLATMVPTILMTAVGIVLLAIGRGAPAVVSGVLVLAFCTSSMTGYILGSMFVRRGATVARFQNDFLSSVSHELRTPLTSIGVFIETLRDERLTDPEEKQQCLALMHREIRRLNGLVERLLDLSRLESGSYKNPRDEVEIGEVIDDSLNAFRTASLNEPTPIAVDIDGNPTVLGDRQTLSQALTNVLINAWKYTAPDNRKIVLTAKRHGRWVDIVISDNGPGIPRADQKRIFGHFERSQLDENQQPPGTGLGLAIVRAIVRAHRGRISVRSSPGQGAEFRIRLRAAQTLETRSDSP